MLASETSGPGSSPGQPGGTVLCSCMIGQGINSHSPSLHRESNAIIKVQVRVEITLTETLIILDVTKTKSEN